jgi:hypothetical protein
MIFPLHRDEVGQTRIGIDVAAHDVEEVDHAARTQSLRNLEALRLRNSAFHRLISREAHTHDEFSTHALAHRREHVESELQARIQGTPVRTLEIVVDRRPELVDEMTVRLQLDAIEPRRLHALRGIRIILDDTRDVPILDLFRKGAVRGRAVAVAGIGQVTEPRNHLVLVGENVVEHWRAVAGDGGGPGGHGHRDTRFGTFDVVSAIASLRHAIFGVGRLVRCDDDAVAKGEVLELEGLQERVG